MRGRSLLLEQLLLLLLELLLQELQLVLRHLLRCLLRHHKLQVLLLVLLDTRLRLR